MWIKSRWLWLFSCNCYHVVQPAEIHRGVHKSPVSCWVCRGRQFFPCHCHGPCQISLVALCPGAGVQPLAPVSLVPLELSPCSSHACGRMQRQTMGSSLCFYSYPTGTQKTPKIPHAKKKNPTKNQTCREYLVIHFAIRNLLVIVLPWYRFQSNDWSQNGRDVVF